MRTRIKQARPSFAGGAGPKGDAAVTATTKEMVTRREPLFSQFDLRYVREAAARTLRMLRLADGMGRRLSGAELQLLMVCSAVVEIVRGELGEEVEDGMTESIGDLVVREVPGLLLCHQPRLGGNGT